MDPRKTHAGSIALGALLGAGSVGAMKDAHAVSVQAVQLRMLGDGQLALGLAVKVGVASTGRELVWNAKGGNPRLNGVPIKDGDAAKLGVAAAAFADLCKGIMPALANRLSQP